MATRRLSIYEKSRTSRDKSTSIEDEKQALNTSSECFNVQKNTGRKQIKRSSMKNSTSSTVTHETADISLSSSSAGSRIQKWLLTKKSIFFCLFDETIENNDFYQIQIVDQTSLSKGRKRRYSEIFQNISRRPVKKYPTYSGNNIDASTVDSKQSQLSTLVEHSNEQNHIEPRVATAVKFEQQN
jgi:hypothetical protein